MKVGSVGALLVITGGAALSGLVFLKDKAQIQKAQRTYDEGKALLVQGKPSEALGKFTESLDAALGVGGVTGARPRALELAGDARRAITLCEALVGLQAQETSGFAIVDDALADKGARALPREPLEKVEAKRLAQLAMSTAEALEKLALEEDRLAPENAGRVKAEYHELAARAFQIGGGLAKDGGFDWVHVAEQGEQRATARGFVAEALAANVADDGARAHEFADKASKALESADAFQGTDEPAQLKKAVRSIAAEGQDRAKVNAFEQAVAALAAKVGTNELGSLLPAVEAVKVPDLEGGHRAAAELDGKKILASQLLAKVKQAATDFQDMVLAGESLGAKVYVDKYEVTNEAFKKFVDEKKPYTDGRTADLWGSDDAAAAAADFFDGSLKAQGPATWSGGTFPEGRERYPVTGVSALEARAFATASGKRLPTYDEFLGAAGKPGTAYPWGNDWRDDGGNVKGKDGKDTTPVGAFPAGAASTGACDLIGNARELVDDNGAIRSVGGSYSSKPDAATLNAKLPVPAEARPKDQGFRCARDLKWKPGE